MTQPTTQAIQQARELVAAIEDANSYAEAHLIALQALSHLPAGSEAVKPVAYLFRERFRDGKGGWWNWSSWSASAEEVAVINQDHMQLECIAVFAAPPSTPPAANVQEGRVGEMTESRAVYFLERFKNDEKMLGPNEQWALDFTIALLRSKQAPTVAMPDEEEQAEVTIPVGWYLVPEVPTEEQMGAGLHQASHDASYADVCQSYMDMVRTPVDAPILRARAEQREAPSEVVGEGCRAVPNAPTDAMIEAGRAWMPGENVVDAYHAMLSAAPTSDGR